MVKHEYYKYNWLEYLKKIKKYFLHVVNLIKRWYHKFKYFRKEGTSMNKIDEILEIVKGNVVKKEEKKSCPIVWILAIVGAVAAVAAIAYAVYRYFNAEVEEELEDDFDEDFDDDFFEDEESDPIIIPKQESETAEETAVEETTEE